jgi:hypothetical protein
MALMWTAPGRVDMVREVWRKSAAVASGETETGEIRGKIGSNSAYSANLPALPAIWHFTLGRARVLGNLQFDDPLV